MEQWNIPDRISEYSRDKAELTPDKWQLSPAQKEGEPTLFCFQENPWSKAQEIHPSQFQNQEQGKNGFPLDSTCTVKIRALQMFYPHICQRT